MGLELAPHQGVRRYCIQTFQSVWLHLIPMRHYIHRLCRWRYIFISVHHVNWLGNLVHQQQIWYQRLGHPGRSYWSRRWSFLRQQDKDVPTSPYQPNLTKLQPCVQFFSMIHSRQVKSRPLSRPGRIVVLSTIPLLIRRQQYKLPGEYNLRKNITCH